MMAAAWNKAGSVAALAGLEVAQPRRPADLRTSTQTLWPAPVVHLVCACTYAQLELLLMTCLMVIQGGAL